MTFRNDRNRGLHSRLPDDDAYWESLAGRIVSDATGTLAGYRRRGTPWWRRLSKASTPLALAAAASVAGAALWLPDIPEQAPSQERAPAVFGLAPTGPLADRLLSAPSPPPMTTLLATPNPETQR